MPNIRSIVENNIVIKTVADYAQKNNISTYVVGGYVRDLIIGRDTNDVDFVLVGDSLKLAEDVLKEIAPKIKLSVFKNFGTAHFTHNNINYEFVCARKESYSKNSRKPKIETGTIEDDQKRRDFTINTLAISLNKSDFCEIIDPFSGLDDLKNKIIRTPLNPSLTFDDDPLRMLRAIRFSCQLGFEIHNECLEAIKNRADRISILSKERITEELNKIISTKKPSIGINLLSDTGLLGLILPEVDQTKGVDIIDKQAHKNVYYHTLEVLDKLSQNSAHLWLRWAALLHDIGKPNTKKYNKTQGWTFHGHEVVGARMVKSIFKRLKLPLNEKKDFVCKIVELHLRPIALVEETVTDSAVRRLLFEAGDDIDALMILCEADITSKNPKKVGRYLNNFKNLRQKLVEVEEKDKLRNWQPPISGEVIIKTFNIDPGKEIGIIKTAIREAILDGEIENSYDAAFKFMLDFVEKNQILN